MEKKYLIELKENELSNIYKVLIKYDEYEALEKIRDSILEIK